MIVPAIMGLGASAIVLLRDHDDSPAPLPEIDDIEVPIARLTRKQWLDFVRIAACGNPHTVTPAFRLGTFELTVRRLCDLGAMTNPRVIDYQGRQVWDADWRKPTSLRAFQAAPMEQYRLFSLSIKRYAKDIVGSIGTKVDGAEITESGALMLAHRAGIPGMVSWVATPGVRARFADNTTQHFQRANGLF